MLKKKANTFILLFKKINVLLRNVAAFCCSTYMLEFCTDCLPYLGVIIFYMYFIYEWMRIIVIRLLNFNKY